MNNPVRLKDPGGKNPILAGIGIYEIVTWGLAVLATATVSHELAKNPPPKPTFLQPNPPLKPTEPLPPMPPLVTAHDADKALKLELLPAHGDRVIVYLLKYE
jgi:hypothetical protein